MDMMTLGEYIDNNANQREERLSKLLLQHLFNNYPSTDIKLCSFLFAHQDSFLNPEKQYFGPKLEVKL